MAGNSVYKVGIVISADASGVKPGVAETKSELASIGTAASATQTKMQQLIATATGLHTGSANSNQRSWTGALAAEGLALDNLRAKYNPLFAVITQYKAAQVEIRTAHAMGALSADEMTAALQRQRQAALASIDTIKGRNAALAQGGNGHNFAATNAMFQLQDIGVTAAMGMSPAMIALQQGSQLAGNFAGMGLKQVGATMAGAFTQLLSPVSLATVAVTGLAAAAIQYFTKSDQETEKANKSLEEHESLIRRLRGAYGEASTGAREYAGESKKILGQDTADSIKNYRKLIDESAKTMLAGGDFSIWDRIMGSGPLSIGDYGGNTYIIGQMQSAIAQLKASAASGTPDIQSFVEKLIEIENHPAVPKKVQEMAQELRKLAAEGVAAQKAISDLLNMPALQRGVLIGGASEQERLRYLDDQRLSLEKLKGEAAARQASLFARSPAEKAAAARQQASLDTSGSADQFNARVEIAGAEAFAQAEKQLTDAKRDRVRSINETVESQQLELSLIGKTVSETEALRMQYQLTSALKAEAAKNGVAVDQDELRLIEEKSRAYGRVAEQMAAINVIRGQQDAIEQQRVELALVGQSDEVRRRSLALLEAEQTIRSQGLTANSAAADLIRKGAVATADQTAKVERLRDAWGEVQSAIDGVVNNGIDKLIDGDWSGALDAVKEQLVGSLTQIGIKNPLANALDGGNRGTITDLGGITDIAGRLFGGDADPSKIVAGAMQSVASMSVNAANVVISGGGLGDAVSRMFNPANSNSGLTGAMSQYAQAIKDIESSGGNYAALGPVTKSGDRAYGAYQVMGANIGPWSKAALGRTLSAEEFLQNPSLQDQVFNHRFGSYVNQYGATGAARAWFGGPGSVNGSGASTDVLGTSVAQYANKFNNSLAGMTGNVTVASQGLGSLGNDFGKFGQSLSQALSGGNGGLASLLGSFTSYGVSTFNSSSQFANAVLSGGMGLWATGGYTGPGGVYEPRGIVHAGEVVFSQADVARHGGVSNVEAMRTGPRFGGYAKGGAVGVTPLPAAAFTSSSNTAQAPSIQIINNSSVPVTGQVEDAGTDERGRRQYRMVMSDAVADGLSTPGGKASKTMRDSYGVRRRGIGL